MVQVLFADVSDIERVFCVEDGFSMEEKSCLARSE